MYHAILANTMTSEQFREAQDKEMREKAAAAEIEKQAKETWLVLPQTVELVKQLLKVKVLYLDKACSTVSVDNMDRKREMLLLSANIIDKVIEFIKEGKYNVS